jgi:hypothetical protein
MISRPTLQGRLQNGLPLSGGMRHPTKWNNAIVFA